MANLTNNKPKDTYPRLVQIEQGRFQNGLGELITGSIVALHVSNSLQVDGNTDIAGDLVVTGSVRAREFITTTISSSVLFQSGSTQSGNSLDDTHTFTGSLNLSGSLLVTASSFGLRVHQQTLPDFGTDIVINETRATIRAKASGSGIFANVSVEDNSNGSSIVKIYGDTVFIGSYTGSIIAFGNTNTSTAFEGTNTFYGNATMNSNRTLTLKPSIFAAITPSTGSLAVTGSSFAYYDGNNWQYMQTGSFALLSDHLIATASISVNETNISTLTSKTGSYALTSSLNVATASITINETNINTLTAATSSYALDSEVEHINSVTSSFALDSEVEHINSVTSSFALATALTVATSSISINEANIANLTSFTGSYSGSASDTYVSIAKLKAIVTGSADFAAFQSNILSL
jgi:hypothetical protein